MRKFLNVFKYVFIVILVVILLLAVYLVIRTISAHNRRNKVSAAYEIS